MVKDGLTTAHPEGTGILVGVTAGPRVYAFEEFRVYADTGELLRRETAVPLPSRAFDALVYLIEHRDRVVQKNEIIASIWHDVAVTDDSLIHAISVLRRELGDDRNDPRYIKTIPRRGYRFIGNVRTVDAAAEPSLEDADAATPDAYGPRAAAEGRRGTPFARLWSWAAGVAGAALVAAITVTSTRAPPAGPSEHVVRLSQPSPPGTRIVSGGMLSLDGRYLAFVAREDDADGTTAIWIRDLHSDELRALEGTTGATKPFWSPDSRRIGFFANGKLLATDLASGTPRTIASAVAPAGGSWGNDGTILFADMTKGLYSVAASGEGAITTVAELDHATGDIAIAWPQFLPDGRHFLYQRVSRDATRMGAYVGDLDTLDSYRLLNTPSPAVFAPPHHLLHVRKDMLVAEVLDPDRLELTGRAIVVARDVSAPSPGADGIVSATGDLLAFQDGIKSQNLAWFDRTGERLSTLSMPTVLFNPRLSPDESRLLATGPITSDPSLWLASLSREEYARLETDAIAPLWSPDGRRVAFTSRGGFDLVLRAVDRRDSERLLVTGPAVKILNDWSPDGERIVYTKLEEGTGLDLWTARTDDAATRPLLATPSSELQARISPDGEWIAYSSDESGALDVYVQRYPELGEKRKVSAGGGGQPQWRSDQRELFYLSADRTIMAVEVSATLNGIAFGTPRRLFRAPIGGDPENARDHYAASADGTRFLVDGSINEGDHAAITVMVNWAAKTGERRSDSASLFEQSSAPR